MQKKYVFDCKTFDKKETLKATKKKKRLFFSPILLRTINNKAAVGAFINPQYNKELLQGSRHIIQP